jgi:hypothetical protein
VPSFYFFKTILDFFQSFSKFFFGPKIGLRLGRLKDGHDQLSEVRTKNINVAV